MFHSYTTALATLAGGLICVVPNVYVAFRILRIETSDSPHKTTSTFYRAEVGKLTITVALLVMVFMSFDNINALALFVTYIVVTLGGWFVPLLFPIRT